MREYIRHPSDVPIAFSIIDSDSSVVHPLHNISRGGLRFSSHKPVEVGLLVAVNIPGRDVEVYGRVAWCRKLDDAYDIGVQFSDAEDAYTMRMVEQVCHIEQYRQRVQDEEGRMLSGSEAASEWIEQYAGTFPDVEYK